MYISHVKGHIIPQTDGKAEKAIDILIIAYTEQPMNQQLHDQIVKDGWDYLLKELGLTEQPR